LTGTLTTANQTLSGTLGVGTNTPDASSKIDVTSTTQGFLTPRMSASQRTAIISPATGLIVYQTDATAGFYYNAGTPQAPSWIILLNGASSVDASSKITGNVPIANGGTGASTLTANSVLLGNGTSTLQAVAPGDYGNILTSDGITWASEVAPIPKGSTSGDLMYWNLTDKKWAILAPGTEGQVLKVSSSGLPVWEDGSASFTCGTNTVSDVDNNTYTTVLIGKQCWTKENLRVTRYTDGTEIPFDATGGSSGISSTWPNLTTGARTIYYNDNTGNLLSVYGYLYNWYAARGIITNGGISTKNICPTGWHIPTETEWIDLEEQLGGRNVPEANAGKRMKSIYDWASPNYADNSSNFTGLPGGWREYNGEFIRMNTDAYFWSSSLKYTNIPHFRSLANDEIELLDIQKTGITPGKYYGMSIRCLRD
jgi:hypothetical protein